MTKTFSAASEVTGTDGLIYTCIRSHTSAASNKPITGADWSTYWKQTSSTGGVWATATAYSAIGDFEVAADTIGIEQAMMRDASGYDHPVDIITRNDYLLIGDKATTAELPTKLCFDDKLTPRVFLWPQPSSTAYVLHYLRVRALEDFDAATDNPDLMAKWIRALIYRLADDLADEYGIILQERGYLSSKGGALVKKAKNADRGAPAQTFVKSAF